MSEATPYTCRIVFKLNALRFLKSLVRSSSSSLKSHFMGAVERENSVSHLLHLIRE